MCASAKLLEKAFANFLKKFQQLVELELKA